MRCTKSSPAWYGLKVSNDHHINSSREEKWLHYSYVYYNEKKNYGDVVVSTSQGFFFVGAVD